MMQPAVPVGCIMTVGCTARVDLGGVHARPAMVAPVGPVVGAGANPTAMVSPPRLLIQANMVRLSQVFASCLVGLRRSLASR